jgi:CxxC motif-containing protein
MEVAIQNKSLYNIRIDHLSLLQEIEENEGELTPELETALALTEEEFQDKAISYGFVIKTFDNDIDIIEAEMKRLYTLKEKAERRKELFKQRLSEAMQQFGVEKITTPLLKLSFRKSESVEITGDENIPEEYFDVKMVSTISKTRIKEAIKAGEIVKGAELVVKQNLQIK